MPSFQLLITSQRRSQALTPSWKTRLSFWMRRQLVEYYYEVEDSRERMDARRTEYLQVPYRLVPRGSEFTASELLEGTRLHLVVQAIRQSELSDL